jgi:hypothetical protein
MAVLPDLPERPGPLARLVFAIPVLGWMIRDLAQRDEALPWFVFSLVALAGVGFLKMGLAGLVLALLLVTGLCLAAIALIAKG